MTGRPLLQGMSAATRLAQRAMLLTLVLLTLLGAGPGVDRAARPYGWGSAGLAAGSSVLCGDDAFEPNNNLASPARLEFGVRYTNLSLCTLDSDYFEVRLPVNGCANAAAPEDVVLTIRHTFKVEGFSYMEGAWTDELRESGGTMETLRVIVRPTFAAPNRFLFRVTPGTLAASYTASASDDYRYDVLVHCFEWEGLQSQDVRAPTSPAQASASPVLAVNGSYFRVLADRERSMREALIHAANTTFAGRPGRLAVVSSAALNAVLADFVRSVSPSIGVWLGAGNYRPPGLDGVEELPADTSHEFWRWISQDTPTHFYHRTALSASSKPAYAGVFVPWRIPTELPVTTPNQCITLAADGRWDTRHCEQRWPLLVEYPSEEVLAAEQRALATRSTRPVCEVCTCAVEPRAGVPDDVMATCDLRGLDKPLTTAYPAGVITVTLSYNPNIDLSEIPLLPTVERFEANRCNLSSADMETADWGSLPSVRLLFLSSNRIQHLRRSMFANLTSVTLLSLVHNEISIVDFDAFDDLPNLQTLNLNFNRITELPLGVLRHNTNLRALRMTDNFVRRLPVTLLHGKPEIFTLALQNNSLTTLPMGFFQVCGGLWSGRGESTSDPCQQAHHQLCLFSRLTINSASFPDQAPLLFFTQLDLSYNEISFLPSGIFKNCSDVSYLRLDHNQLGDNLVPNQFEGLNDLATLLITHNNIRHVPRGTFAGTTLVTITSATFSIPPVLFMLDNPTVCTVQAGVTQAGR